MKELTNINFRQGFRVDIFTVLDDIESEFKADMNATMKCLENYEADLETMHDLDKVAAKLYMLQKLGYINEDEYSDMIDYAEDLRNKIIKKEGEEDGKEN